MFSSSRRRAAALVAVVVLVGAGAAAVAYGLGAHQASNNTQAVAPAVTSAPPVPTTTRTANTSGPTSIAEIAKNVSPGVVEVDVTTSGSGSSQVPFGGGGSGGTSEAEGTGFVVDTAGHIVTNEHVIQGATSITVTFDDDSTYKATLVGKDESTDLAVLKVNAPASVLHPLTFGDSSTVGVGDGVVAIGDPYQLDDTVTSGIVSAVGREITSPNNMPIENAIQTDAAINHGNSGGPLLNLDGKVIGVTAQIQSQGGGNEGIGFAIPSNTVSMITNELISNGVAKHALLGIKVATIPASLASTIGDAAGVAVTQVESGTGAGKAGLKASTGTTTIAGVQYPTGGDVITSVDGTAVTTAQQLRAIIDTHQPGDVVKLVVVQAGQSRTVSATLGTRPATS
ncbi:MAG TPA: trypsin-like peptidase domain-containing protein [Gaiellaceae bacterium]|nr:trypsin-like peptidase domain-containing protein [Gaiellaceae bacterium]